MVWKNERRGSLRVSVSTDKLQGSPGHPNVGPRTVLYRTVPGLLLVRPTTCNLHIQDRHGLAGGSGKTEVVIDREPPGSPKYPQAVT